MEVSDRASRELERLASNGDLDAALKLHRILIDRPCSDGGLSHELAEPRRVAVMTSTNTGSSQHTERLSKCSRCQAELPFAWCRQPRHPGIAGTVRSLQDYLERDDEANFIAHIRTSPLEP